MLSNRVAPFDPHHAHVIERAAKGELSVEALIAEAERLASVRQNLAVIDLYKLWLDHTPSPMAYAIWFNFGVVLADAGNSEGAEQAYHQSILTKPDFIPARLNLGTVLERKGLVNGALGAWSDILNLDAHSLRQSEDLHLQALNNIGRLLELNKRFDEAEHFLAQSLTISPNQADARQHWIHLRQKQCKWPINSGPLTMSQDQFENWTSALSTLSLFEDPAVQLASARNFIQKKVKLGQEQLAAQKSYGHERLRIGYLSSDFCLHPVSLLTVEVFEKHDRNHFEVFGFCGSPEDGSQLRARVIQSFDHFFRIQHMSDDAVAQLIREQEIDILVDLHGLTSGVRPNIFSYRPAPLQVTWLGFPGTTGHPEMDYVISDHYVIPDGSEQHFSEKPLRLPYCFQPSDNQRIVGKIPSRAEYGLPDDTFVFCCHNNNYKITAEMFEVWMRILARTPGSVFWLLADNQWSEANFIREAIRCGIDPERLIFARRVAPPDYLARYQLADLFLDTFPFNAGTTANDALWMGLPVLTLTGRSFISRMAGCLLTALELESFIAYSTEYYEEKAVDFFKRPEMLLEARHHLLDQKATSRLYNMDQFVADLETGFQGIFDADIKAGSQPEFNLISGFKTLLNTSPYGVEASPMLPILHKGLWNELKIHTEAVTDYRDSPEFSKLPRINDLSVDMIFASQNLVRYYASDLASILENYHRILKRDGIVFIICSDLHDISQKISDGLLHRDAYESPAGPITYYDVLFGHTASIAHSLTSAAHRSGYTKDSLADALGQAGFPMVRCISGPEGNDIWAFAAKGDMHETEFSALIQTLFLL